MSSVGHRSVVFLDYKDCSIVGFKVVFEVVSADYLDALRGFREG